jgi:1,4-alpha-glucan branching enzyme
MDYFAGALGASAFGAVTYQESHDEAGNGRDTDRTIIVAVNGAPLFGTTRTVAEARVRLVNGLNFLSAGTPLFLFGEEVGAEKKYTYNQVLQNREDLYGLRATTGANLFRFFAAVIRLRLASANGGLRSRNIEVAYTHNDNRIIAFRRWDGDQNFLVIASFNNRPFNSPSYTLVSDKLGDENWHEIFNSDAAAYGGANVGNGGQTLSARNQQFTCVLPANGLIAFART